MKYSARQSVSALIWLIGFLIVSCYPSPDKNESLLEEKKEQKDKYSHLKEAYQKSQQQKVQDLVVNEKGYPYATAIPGKQGYVLSPYSQKPLDVRNQKSGDLVLDPYYARSEKKYFRLP